MSTISTDSDSDSELEAMKKRIMKPAGPSKENNFKQPRQKKNKPVIGKKYALKIYDQLALYTSYILVGQKILKSPSKKTREIK